MAFASPAYYATKADKAEQCAAMARTEQLVKSWHRVADTYRWLAYQRSAFGRWPPEPQGDDLALIEPPG